MKLSQVMKTLLVTALVAGGAALAVQPSPALAAKKKTNVLLFLTDDTGMDQLELYGYNSVPPAPANRPRFTSGMPSIA